MAKRTTRRTHSSLRLPRTDALHGWLLAACPSPLFLFFALFFWFTPSAAIHAQTPVCDRNLPAAQLQQNGDELREQKMFADALDCYQMALRNGPDTAELHNKLGFTQMRMQHYGEARKEFERAVKRDRNFAAAYNNLGAMEYSRRKYGRAIGAYRHAIGLDQSSAIYHKNLASAYLAHNEVEKAVQEYLTALRLNPNVFDNNDGEGNVLAPVTSSDPGRYYYSLAKAMAKAGDVDRCLAFLRRAMEEDADVPKKVMKDAAFDSARNDPRVQALLQNPPPALR